MLWLLIVVCRAVFLECCSLCVVCCLLFVACGCLLLLFVVVYGGLLCFLGLVGVLFLVVFLFVV